MAHSGLWRQTAIGHLLFSTSCSCGGTVNCLEACLAQESCHPSSYSGEGGALPSPALTLLKEVVLQKHLSSLERKRCCSQSQLGPLAPETVFCVLPVTAVNPIRALLCSESLSSQEWREFFTMEHTMLTLLSASYQSSERLNDT